jgi:hypothetical protein
LFEFCLKRIFPSQCQSEVDEFDVIGVFGEEEEVLRLQIAMRDLE